MVTETHKLRAEALFKAFQDCKNIGEVRTALSMMDYRQLGILGSLTHFVQLNKARQEEKMNDANSKHRDYELFNIEDYK